MICESIEEVNIDKTKRKCKSRCSKRGINLAVEIYSGEEILGDDML